MISRKKSLAIILLSLLFVLCFAMGLGLSGCSEKSSKTGNDNKEEVLSYEQINGYSLVLKQYQIPNPDKVVKILNPNGAEVEFKGNPFVPTMVGKYSIVYTNKTETLTVLLKSDSLKIDIEDHQEEYVAGNSMYLPSATIKDDFKEYTTYTVNVIKDNKTLTSYKNIKKGVDILLDLNASGDYVLEYVCIDGFGQTKTQKTDFSVIDEQVIIYQETEDSFSYGETVDFGSPFGFYKGSRYQVAITLTTPTNQQRTVANGRYTFDEAGVYTALYSSVVDGKTVTVSKDIEVNYSVKNIVNVENGDIKINQDLPEYSKVKGTAAIVTGMSDFEFNYEPVINLNELGKNDNLIAFVPYSVGNSQLTDLVLTLTDVYDESNTLSFYWFAKAHWGKGHSYLTVRRNNNDYGISNELRDNDEGKYGQVRPEGAVIYEGSFFGESNGASDIFTLQYDVSENAVYCIVRGSQWKVLDVDDDPNIAFEDRFYGFTTGEVYLSIKTIGNSSAGICITELAGKNFGGTEIEVSELSNDFLVLGKDLNTLPVGGVGLAYPIPSVKISNNSNQKVDYTVSVKYNGNVQAFETDGKFIPDYAGQYEVIYKGEYKGFEIVKSATFTVLQELEEITLSFPAPAPVISGDTYKLPNFTVSGINGNYSTTVVVKDEDKEFTTDIFGEYVLNTTKPVSVVITVEDLELVGRNRVFEFDIDIISATVLNIKGEVLRSVREGATISFPDFDVINNSTTSTLEKKIIINEGTANQAIIQSGESYTVPAVDNLTVRFVGGYQTSYESDKAKYTYNMNVIAKNADYKELLSAENATIALNQSDRGLSLSTTSSGELFEMPYSLPTKELSIKFSIRQFKLNFSTLKIVLTDSVKSDKQVVMSISNISSGTATFKIGGDSTAYQIKYTTSTLLYNFEIIFNTYENAVFNTSGNKIAGITKFSDGTPFISFSSSLAYLSFELDGVSGTSELLINEIANQKFGYYMTSTGKKDNDNSGPVIYSDYKLSVMDAEYGSTVILPEFFAKDVLQTTSSLKLTLLAPNGEPIPIVNNSFVASQYGQYVLNCEAMDGKLKNYTEKELVINVRDDVAPVLTVNGSYKTEYKLNSSIKIANASATDNNSDNMNVYVFIKDSAGSIYTVKMGDSVKLNRVGTYKLIYRVEDDFLNVSTVEYVFVVKA